MSGGYQPKPMHGGAPTNPKCASARIKTLEDARVKPTPPPPPMDRPYVLGARWSSTRARELAADTRHVAALRTFVQWHYGDAALRAADEYAKDNA